MAKIKLLHASNGTSTPPTLDEGEFAVNALADPPQLWTGVPTSRDPSGRIDLLDGTDPFSLFLPLTGGTLSNPGNLTINATTGNALTVNGNARFNDPVVIAWPPGGTAGLHVVGVTYLENDMTCMRTGDFRLGLNVSGAQINAIMPTGTPLIICGQVPDGTTIRGLDHADASQNRWGIGLCDEPFRINRYSALVYVDTPLSISGATGHVNIPVAVIGGGVQFGTSLLTVNNGRAAAWELQARTYFTVSATLEIWAGNRSDFYLPVHFGPSSLGRWIDPIGVTKVLINHTGITLSPEVPLTFAQSLITPPSPVNGMVYFDNTSQTLRLYASGAWRTITHT